MKKQKHKSKKSKSAKKKSPAIRRQKVADSEAKPPEKVEVRQKSVRNISKDVGDKKKGNERSVAKVINITRQFLKESKMELKKVKWPTRKELLASTGVVIVLTLIIAFFLGLVDFGLIKIIKNIVR